MWVSVFNVMVLVISMLCVVSMLNVCVCVVGVVSVNVYG